MRQVFVSNSLSGKKEPLRLVDASTQAVGIYACGITVYDTSHIGHAMQAIYFDVIRNYLKMIGYQVTYVRNYTDVDDKIIARAAKRGISPRALVDEVIASSEQDMAAIGVAPADHEPRVSQMIPQIIALIETLIEKKFAYATEQGDVYYRVRRKTDYGKLSHRNVDELRSGTRDLEVQDKEDGLDFALWKADDVVDASWDSPWGRGRPGWHIECSAMAKHCLGDTFEIHGGGRDLIFPHHENEIAQSEAASGKVFAHHWLHSGLLTINQQKMSKSLGNQITIQDFLSKWPAEVLRLGFLQNHYTSNVDFSESVFRNCLRRLVYCYETLSLVEQATKGISGAASSDMLEQFHGFMCDDFSTPQVIGLVNRSLRRARELMAKKLTPAAQQEILGTRLAVLQIGQSLGLWQKDPVSFIAALKAKWLQDKGLSEDDVVKKISDRGAARRNKDFAGADQIRAELMQEGIEIRDTPEGSTWTVALQESDLA